MTQRRVYTEADTAKTWSRIGNDDWGQMAWFVKLANTTRFADMSPGEQLLWQEEFVAMYLRGHGPAMDAPLNSKRYPRSNSPSASVLDPPTASQMQEVRDTIKQPIDGLADSRGAWIPPHGMFEISYSVNFVRNPAHLNNPDSEPRYLVNHNEVGSGLGSNPYLRSFLLRLLRLLEAYPDKNRRDICADKLYRCPHCQRVFLQVHRSARYCGPKCYTVAGMQRIRAERKAALTKKPSRKGGHGKSN